jgi:hypothetical protein
MDDFFAQIDELGIMKTINPVYAGIMGYGQRIWT